MRKFAIAAVLLMPCLSVHAEDAAPVASEAASEKPKSRTLSDFAQTIISEGVDRTVNSTISESVGLSGEVATKAVRYSNEISPDKRAHAFHVIYQNSEEGKPVPTNFIWTIMKTEIVGSDKFIDATNFLVSPEGRLLAAASAKGKAHESPLKKLDATSSKVKKAFAEEKKFYLTDSLTLNYNSK